MNLNFIKMGFDSIYLTGTAVVFIGFWIWVSYKNNGGFDPKEIVQMLLGLLSIYAVYKIKDIGIVELGFILGALLISVGLKIFKPLINGKN